MAFENKVLGERIQSKNYAVTLECKKNHGFMLSPNIYRIPTRVLL
jgi:hypothetical protein